MLSLLFSITVLELFVGGGGRWIEFGPLTLRMVLFAVCASIGFVAVMLPRRRFDNLSLAICFVLAYLLIHVPELTPAALAGIDTPTVLTELQQSLYWLAAPFFACVLSSTYYIERTATLAKWSGALLSFGYVGLVLALAAHLLNFADIYAILHHNGEFISRGGSLMIYKGDIYLGVSLLFIVASRGRFWFPTALLISIALVLTLTRGFILSTSAAMLLLLSLQRRYFGLVVCALLVATAIGVVWYYFPSINDALANSRSISSQQRIDDMVYIWNHLSARTLLVGQGLGSTIDGRIEIENTFLWALWKLGILGLVFWVTPLVLSGVYYAHIRSPQYRDVACAFITGTVLVYLETLSNPYLNNPIGLSFVMFAMFSLRTLSRQGRLGDALSTENPRPATPASS